MTVQTTYNESPAIAFNGMLAQSFSLRQVDSGIVETAEIGLGVAVKAGSSDGQVVACGSNDAVKAISLYSGQIEASVYGVKDQLPLLSKGRYYATANGPLTVGDEIAFDPATGKVGDVSAGVTTLAFGSAHSSAAADGDLFVVEVSF